MINVGYLGINEMLLLILSNYRQNLFIMRHIVVKMIELLLNRNDVGDIVYIVIIMLRVHWVLLREVIKVLLTRNHFILHSDQHSLTDQTSTL